MIRRRKNISAVIGSELYRSAPERLRVKPTPEARAEAKLNPGGWVYVIEGQYGRDESVPPEAIEGAWRVDEAGEIVDEFIPNPNFVPGHPKREG